MNKPTFDEALVEILRKDPRYGREAYQFVREALDYTIKVLVKPKEGPGRHVSGSELLDGIRRFSLEQFGPITHTVLTKWGIKECIDFGNIVFNLVEEGILGKTDQDRVDDFSDGYDFHTAFITPFEPEPELKKKAVPPADNKKPATKGKKPASKTKKEAGKDTTKNDPS